MSELERFRRRVRNDAPRPDTQTGRNIRAQAAIDQLNAQTKLQAADLVFRGMSAVGDAGLAWENKKVSDFAKASAIKSTELAEEDLARKQGRFRKTGPGGQPVEPLNLDTDNFSDEHSPENRVTNLETRYKEWYDDQQVGGIGAERIEKQFAFDLENAKLRLRTNINAEVEEFHAMERGDLLDKALIAIDQKSVDAERLKSEALDLAKLHAAEGTFPASGVERLRKVLDEASADSRLYDRNRPVGDRVDQYMGEGRYEGSGPAVPWLSRAEREKAVVNMYRANKEYIYRDAVLSSEAERAQIAARRKLERDTYARANVYILRANRSETPEVKQGHMHELAEFLEKNLSKLSPEVGKAMSVMVGLDVTERVSRDATKAFFVDMEHLLRNGQYEDIISKIETKRYSSVSTDILNRYLTQAGVSMSELTDIEKQGLQLLRDYFEPRLKMLDGLSNSEEIGYGHAYMDSVHELLLARDAKRDELGPGMDVTLSTEEVRLIIQKVRDRYDNRTVSEIFAGLPIGDGTLGHAKAIMEKEGFTDPRQLSVQQAKRARAAYVLSRPKGQLGSDEDKRVTAAYMQLIKGLEIKENLERAGALVDPEVEERAKARAQGERTGVLPQRSYVPRQRLTD
jgi:hypothetical protein